jgi:hypothetical protein
LVLAGCLIFGGVGCGGDEAPAEVPKPKDPNKKPEDPENFNPEYKLQIVGNTAVQLQKGHQLSIQVMYTKDGKGFGGQTIYFSPKGAYADSRLSRYQVLTDAYGFAETVIQGGQMVTSYTIEASAAKAGPVKWDVQIVEPAEPPAPPVPVLEGAINVTSNFNIKTDFVGSDLAQVLNVLDKISDDPEDPGKFVVDTVLAEVDNQAVLVIASVLKPTLYVEVNKLLTSIAPQLVADIKQLSADVSTIARHFELQSTMASPTPQQADKPMVVDHTAYKIAWSLQGKRVEYAFSQAPQVKNVQLTWGGDSDLVVAEHDFKIQYGVFLVGAINSLVIPNIEPTANDITSLMQARVNCQKVAETINNTVGAGGVPLWKLACDTGVAAVAKLLEDQIAQLDNGDSTLSVSGVSKLRDLDQDGKLDALNQGVWTGSFKLDKCIAPLAGPQNTFWGQLSTTVP